MASLLSSGILSAFLAGFAILFLAVFGFSFAVRSIINTRTRQHSPKHILRSSLWLALAVAFVGTLVFYFVLANI